MAVIQEGASNPLTTFNLDGLDYQKSIYEVYYGDFFAEGEEIDRDKIRVGIRSISSKNHILVRPSKVTDYEDGFGVPYTDLNILMSDLSTYLGFSYGGSTGIGGVVFAGTVKVFGDLPSAGLYTNKYFMVQEGSGGYIIPLTDLRIGGYDPGPYFSDGVLWHLRRDLDFTDIAVDSSGLDYSNSNKLDGTLEDFDNEFGNINSTITTIEGDITGLESDVATNTSDIATNTTNITTNTSDISDNASDISTLEGRTITGVNSISGGGDLTADRQLELVNDEDTPSNLSYYGTNSSGQKGWSESRSHYIVQTGRVQLLSSTEWTTDSNDLYGPNDINWDTGAGNAGLATPEFSWEHKGLMVGPNTFIKSLTIAVEGSNNQMEDFTFLGAFRAPTSTASWATGITLDSEMTNNIIVNEGFQTAVTNSGHGAAFANPPLNNKMFMATVPVNYLVTEWGMLSMYFQTISPLTANNRRLHTTLSWEIQ